MIVCLREVSVFCLQSFQLISNSFLIYLSLFITIVFCKESTVKSKVLAKSLPFFMILITLVGCGGKAVAPEPTNPNPLNLPEWFMNPPTEPGFLFSTAEATSRSLQMSVNKAKQTARADLAQQIEAKVKSMVKQFTEEVGLGEDSEFLTQTTDVSKSIASTTLRGTKVRKVDTRPRSGGTQFQTYLLMELNLETTNSGILDGIKKEQNLYTRFRASQGFAELEEEVEKYEDFKNQQ